MTFRLLYEEIEKYLGIEDDEEANWFIRKFINDKTLDFARLAEWLRLVVSEDITLDGSNSYVLDNSNLDNYFITPIALIDSSGVAYTNYSYKDYLQLSTKSYAYSILGDTLYVEGIGVDLTLLFISPGLHTLYPFDLTGTGSDTNEPIIIKHYPDIIKQMVLIRFYDMMKDQESVKREDLELQRLLAILKRKENREKGYGKFKFLRR
jgi:hypothetical protein